MFLSQKKARGLLLEATKVLVIFVVFYLLQNQIFEVRYDVYGRTSGLAEAQARTSTELGDTQEYVRLALEDSALKLNRAKQALADTMTAFARERELLLRAVEGRAQRIESDLRERLERDDTKLRSLAEVASANAARLESLGDSVAKDADEMKRTMIFPTVQLRGKGTVGSGVLIYSEPQPGRAERPVYTTFALTACHVVQEVLGETLEKGKVVTELRVLQEGDEASVSTFSAELRLYDTDRDIALLRINSANRFRHLARLAPLDDLDDLDVFSPAYAVGCPLGNRPMPTLGEISSKSKTVGKQVFWMLNAPTFFGNSGGGVYRLPRFQLIGVSSMIYTYGKTHPTVVPHMGLFVPLGTIYEWLEAEGFDFVVERRPVPNALRESLVYLPRAGPRSLAVGADATGKRAARGDKPRSAEKKVSGSIP